MRNKPCHCGSGKKFKRCCLKGDRHHRLDMQLMAKAEGVTVAELEAEFSKRKREGRERLKRLMLEKKISHSQAMLENFKKLYGGIHEKTDEALDD